MELEEEVAAMMMDVLIRLIELALSLLLGFLSVWLAFKMLARLTTRIDDLEARSWHKGRIPVRGLGHLSEAPLNIHPET